MTLIRNLISQASAILDLEVFVQANSVQIYDFFISQKNSSLQNHRTDVESLILPNFNVISEIDYSDNSNKSFLFCLLDVSQRFGLSTEFQQLYILAQSHDLVLNSRIHATAKFLIGIRRFEDYVERIPAILSLLVESYTKEEDDEQKTIGVFVQFYLEVLSNFSHNLRAIERFRAALKQYSQLEEFQLLFSRDFQEVFLFSYADADEFREAVYTKLDELLERSSRFLAFSQEPKLIEANTHYSELLSNVSREVDLLREIAAKLYRVVATDEIFRSMQRGVKVLTEQNQLLAYFSSYGKMHKAKMTSAFSLLDFNSVPHNCDIYDWGCGQGLATICLLERLIESDNVNAIEKIVLIEPSEIALKRASLHIKHFVPDIEIVTINKDFDSLEGTEFNNSPIRNKVHLFSNVLDVDMFNMEQLIRLIVSNLEGNNIFLCVSPFVSEEKNTRIDGFVRSFSAYSDYSLMPQITEAKGRWIGTTWSRIIRVFKCTINKAYSQA